ncbi:MAG: fibronectin type III domain-containing protein [bacterium]
MKKLLSIAAIALMATTALVLVQCDVIAGDGPTGVKVEMDTDSTVKVTWNSPVAGTPDKYIVSFNEVGTTSYTMLGEVTTTSYIHNPMGKTGKYKVEADFDGTKYQGTTEPTTVPVANASTTVSELNATGSSGYGWNLSTGTGTTYSMTQSGNAANVDFYISDFAAGYSGATYSIVSPDLGPSDPGNVVPSGSWKVNAFTNALTSEQGPLPSHNPIVYFNYTDLVTSPIVVGCYTDDGYYALVKINDINTGAGTVQVQTWFQLIEGLRLVQH